MELVLDEPKFLCVVHISPNTLVHVAKLSLEGNIPLLLCGDGINYCTSSGFRSKFYIYYVFY